MAEILDGDELKHRKYQETTLPRSIQQRILNSKYATGTIDLETWRRESDRLSFCAADGKTILALV